MKRLSRKFQRVAEGKPNIDFNPNLYDDPETGEKVKKEVVEEIFDGLNWTADSEHEAGGRSNDYYVPDDAGSASLEATGKGNFSAVEAKFGKLVGFDFDNVMYALEEDDSLEDQIKDVMKDLADFAVSSFDVSVRWSVNANGVTCTATASNIEVE